MRVQDDSAEEVQRLAWNPQQTRAFSLNGSHSNYKSVILLYPFYRWVN